MPWYGWVILGVSIVLSIIAGGLKFFFVDAKRYIEQKIKDGDELFCEFRVTDKQTGQELFFGEKMRKVNDLVFDGKFRRYGIEPIYMYVKDTEVCGIECTVMFWATARTVKKEYEFNTLITEAGMRLLRNAEMGVFI